MNEQKEWKQHKQNNGETQKTIRQKYVYKQASMESQRNVAYSKNKKKTFYWLDISAKIILLPNLQYSVQIYYVLRQGHLKVWPSWCKC